MKYDSASGIETTFYVTPLFEKVTTSTTTDYRHYIYAANRPVMVISRTATATNVRSLLTNNQDGISTIVTDSTGALYTKESFTAYGLRRDAGTWSGAPKSGDRTTVDAVTREGYTFQTVLGAMGLNHMNGRVQDTVTGIFLSADPAGGNASDIQSWNLHNYVSNNPLSRVDPTGFHGVTRRNDGGPIDKEPSFHGGLADGGIGNSVFGHDMGDPLGIGNVSGAGPLTGFSTSPLGTLPGATFHTAIPPPATGRGSSTGGAAGGHSGTTSGSETALVCTSGGDVCADDSLNVIPFLTR